MQAESNIGKKVTNNNVAVNIQAKIKKGNNNLQWPKIEKGLRCQG